MTDGEIISLFFARNEAAIEETDGKYRASLMSLTERITENKEDAEECVNDTYLEAWRRIPPDEPQYFFAYLAKIARHFSLGMIDKKRAQKRSARIVELSDELCEALASDSTVPQEYEALELARALDRFIGGLEREASIIFLRRYFWQDKIAEIASLIGAGEEKVKSSLYRTRKKLAEFLKEEGYSI